MRHLAENLCINQHCREHLYLFYAAAKAYSFDEFSDNFVELKSKFPKAAHVLENVLGFEKWSRVQFPGNKYDVMTTNIAKSLNSILMDEREYPMSYIFNSIAKKFGEKFRERHAFVSGKENIFVPSAERILRDNKSASDSLYVDDWIPCESPGKPAFSTSRKGNEMWVSLLEKAYTKLHGSYEALEGGLVQNDLVDLTGGSGEEIDMRSAEAQIDLASGRLWSQLLRFKQEGFLLGAGSPSGSCLFNITGGNSILLSYDLSTSQENFSHTVIFCIFISQVREVDGHKLVQIRNPWANEVEWNGPLGVSFSRTTAGFRNYQSSHDSIMFYIGMRILKTRGRHAEYNIYLHESVSGTDYVNSLEISCMPNSPTLLLTGIERGERMVCPLQIDEARCLILGSPWLLNVISAWVLEVSKANRRKMVH
ncbi:Calpain-type cysteine protease DEK1 [Capsicum baccatum]|uniref:Calpain-type cysteine protease DEK1 n=1 Tax=Capsicum baccatum TaxID=33114 RepID=A0A2G2V827_CAPBA|nr:Calpain-type cysteine protease DEK1 [Capsicum baccatum]